jgi:hypothetical protein
MAKKTPKDDLIESCGSAKQIGDREKIAIGRTTWFQGKPAPAEKGMIALDTAQGFRILMREEDVKSVESADDGYFVEVVDGAETIVRFEQVVKADRNSCHCHEGTAADAPGTSARFAGFVGDRVLSCSPVVRYKVIFVIDSRGVGRFIFIPYLEEECKLTDKYGQSVVVPPR